jgi:prolyl 4-hydroxylase
MNCPIENGEGLQVLHYGPGGQFRPHFDFLVPSDTASSDSITRAAEPRCTSNIRIAACKLT